MINQDIIAQDLFYKIRSRFPKMEMGDENGQSTFEAAKGRFFDFDAIFNEQNLGTVSVSINEPGSLKLYFNKNILEDADELTSKTWYSFLREMRKFAMKRLMSFDTRDISKTNLDKRDYGYLANKGPVMSESMMRGTSRTSYRPLEALQRTKLIIRHSKPVDESIPGARSRNLESLFIENAAGERFKYPFKHLAGAKAMQRHVANEGLPHDPIGQKIIEMSEDMAKLANFKNYVYREDLMNTETNHIVERAQVKLQELKDKMNRLSMQHHYEAFKKDCEGSLGANMPLIDELTLEDYKDKFTVRSFKEDIADVFPLLHRIMQENELDLEEVAQVEDQTQELNLEDVAKLTPESIFHEWADTLVETRLSPEDLSKLGELLSEHFPVGLNGDNVTGSLEELGIDVPDATKIQLAQLAEQQGPDANAVDIVVEFLNKFQPEIYGALNLNVQEGQKLDAVGKWVSDLGRKVANDLDPRNLGKAPTMKPSIGTPPYVPSGGRTSQDVVNDIVNRGTTQDPDNLLRAAKAAGWPDKGVDENMEQTPEEKRHAMEYLQKVARAIKSGEAQPEEIESEFFDTLPMLGVSDEKTFAAWQRITGDTPAPKRSAMSDADIDAELRGIKGSEEDDDANFLSQLRNKAKSGSIGQDTTGFGAEVDEAQDASKKSGMKEIAEFIMGFYDRNTGNFPLGETGVAIKVQKEFGDKAGALAERLIQKMAAQGGANNELSDIKRLSGMQGGVDEELDPNYKSPEFDEFAKTFKGTEGGMKPIDMYGGAQAARNDEKGQQYYKDRSSGGFTNAVKDLLGKPKADPKYGPKEIPKKINEGTEFIDLQKLAGIGSEQKKTTKSSEMFDLKKLAGI